MFAFFVVELYQLSCNSNRLGFLSLFEKFYCRGIAATPLVYNDQLREYRVNYRVHYGDVIFLLLVHDLQPFGVKHFNMSHTVLKLSFGQEYPGIINPLDGHQAFDVETTHGMVTGCGINGIFYSLIGGIMFQYFIKVVPTLYRRLNNETMGTNQFAVTKHQRPVRSAAGEHGLPGWYFLKATSLASLNTELKYSVKVVINFFC